MIGLGVALSLLLASSGADLVVLKTGERVEGRVIEASPTNGVQIQLPDGRVRWIHPMSVERIDRADGTSSPLRQEPAAPAPSPPEAPVLAPGTPSTPSAAPPGVPVWQGPATIDTQPEPGGERSRTGRTWFSVGVGHAKPLGRSGRSAPTLKALVGNGQTGITLEGGLLLNERDSFGAVFDFTSGSLGDELRPLCARYGSDCDTATAQLGVFLRRDFDPRGRLNPWASIGIGREWLAGEVFEPTGGGDSVQILSAPGWQLPRIGLGMDWRTSRVLGLGLYATLALGIYDRVTIDRVNVGDGLAVHGWAQLGVRAILNP